MANRTELFLYEEMEPQAPIRPLGEFSDYVVDTLPWQASEIRPYLAKAAPEEDQIDTDRYAENLSLVPKALLKDIKDGIDRTIEGVGSEELGAALADPQMRDLALFDMMIAENIAAHFGIEPHPKLQVGIEWFAQRANHVPFITYEDLIFVNPLEQDPRTFTTGQTGQAERDFYMAHNIIEARLIPAVAGLKEASDLLGEHGSAGVDHATDNIHEFVRGMQFSQSYLGDLKDKMTREDFNKFRAPYFFTHPVRNPAKVEDNPAGRRGFGPSGRFTGTIPLADMYIMGDRLSEFKEGDFNRILQDGYYPRFQNALIEEALQKGSSGRSLIAQSEALGNPTDLERALQRAVKRIDFFRHQHTDTVVHQIPQVASGEQQGSGSGDGENTMEYLKKHRVSEYPTR